MFFPERITNIKETDKVLEIGPGGTPHPRADVFLEKNFQSDEEYRQQRGLTPSIDTQKPIIYYDGNRFPFKDKEFDYVICSHVLEHIEDVDSFINEMKRVGKRGYIEYPTVYYDYLYNFDVHKTFLLYQNNVICWMSKEESYLNQFSHVQRLFYQSLVEGCTSLINELSYYFFQGFEWSDDIQTKNVNNIEMVCYDANTTKLLTHKFTIKNSPESSKEVMPILNKQSQLNYWTGAKKIVKKIIRKIAH